MQEGGLEDGYFLVLKVLIRLAKFKRILVYTTGFAKMETNAIQALITEILDGKLEAAITWIIWEHH